MFPNVHEDELSTVLQTANGDLEAAIPTLTQCELHAAATKRLSSAPAAMAATTTEPRSNIVSRVSRTDSAPEARAVEAARLPSDVVLLGADGDDTAGIDALHILPKDLDYVPVGADIHFDLDEATRTTAHSYDWAGVFPANSLTGSSPIYWDWVRGSRSMSLRASDLMQGAVVLQVLRPDASGTYFVVARSRVLHVGPHVTLHAETNERQLAVRWTQHPGPTVNSSAWLGLYNARVTDNRRFIMWLPRGPDANTEIVIPIDKLEAGDYDVRAFPYSMVSIFNSAQYNTISQLSITIAPAT
mmetsp:Transcript_11185/g.23772  ORF Transcript_11185/g.23772 Transcript_11185/m.23772 type:complete len:300 (-) Transcript_11185:90-989(-)